MNAAVAADVSFPFHRRVVEERTDIDQNRYSSFAAAADQSIALVVRHVQRTFLEIDHKARKNIHPHKTSQEPQPPGERHDKA